MGFDLRPQQIQLRKPKSFYFQAKMMGYQITTEMTNNVSMSYAQRQRASISIFYSFFAYF